MVKRPSRKPTAAIERVAATQHPQQERKQHAVARREFGFSDLTQRIIDADVDSRWLRLEIRVPLTEPAKSALTKVGITHASR
jgi:hypothetical protein